MTRYWRTADGLRLDTGPFVKALEYATGREAIVLGKPAPAFFAAALERIGLAPEQVLMIGDDIRGDIGGARDAGIDGLLVRTGKYQDEDLGEAVRPRAVLDSIADLPRWWMGQAAS
jgi:HAD superfamily hydrolase (TIGR01450 family)